MPRYIDADGFIKWLAVGDLRSPSEICYSEGDVKTMIDMQPTADVVEVVRCSDCAVPHNRWTGCPNLNGMIPPPNFFCARGERKQPTADATDICVGDKTQCEVCERITEANKDIFWVFARTHQPEDKEEFHRVPARFCPACGREIGKINNMPQRL